MAPASNEDQFKFLISCIRYSNNGKVDFDEVARECEIVSKGAAAKRYERMMKHHGIHQSQTTPTSIRDTPIPSRPKTSSAAGSSKKRKLNQAAEASLNADDDEGFSDVKAEGSNGRVKPEQSSKKVKLEDPKLKVEHVKDEDSPNYPVENNSKEQGVKEEMSAPMGKDTKPCNSSLDLQKVDDTSLLNDFLAFGAHFNQDGSSQVKSSASARACFGGPEMIDTRSDRQGVQESIVIAD